MYYRSKPQVCLGVLASPNRDGETARTWLPLTPPAMPSGNAGRTTQPASSGSLRQFRGQFGAGLDNFSMPRQNVSCHDRFTRISLWFLKRKEALMLVDTYSIASFVPAFK